MGFGRNRGDGGDGGDEGEPASGEQRKITTSTRHGPVSRVLKDLDRTLDGVQLRETDAQDILGPARRRRLVARMFARRDSDCVSLDNYKNRSGRVA